MGHIPEAEIFRIALLQKLAEERRKLAFVPADALAGGQAAGPGGMPVPPGAAGPMPPPGAPMDPAMMAAMMGGAPPPGAPMDPAMMAAMMGGAPPPPGAMPPPPPGAPPGAPMDPALMAAMMGGAPPPGAPMDPALLGALPPPPPPELLGPPPGGPSPQDGVTIADADVVDRIVRRTMDIVRETLEMVGKAKPREQAVEEEDTGAEPSGPAMVGPVTGIPGLPADAFGPIGGSVPKSTKSPKSPVIDF